MTYLDIIAQRYEKISTYALSLIAKRIKSIGQLSAADRQTLKNIADITGDMKKITKKLAEFTRLNIADIEKLYDETITEEGETYKPLYDLKNKKYVPYSQNKKAQTIANHWAKQTKKTLVNLSKTKALRVNRYNIKGEVIGSMPFEGAFQEAIDTAVTSVSIGAVDFNLAMRDTIKKLGSSGLKVTYGTDKNGRPVTRSLASMARQNILYGTKEAINAYDDKISEELGCDGIEISFSSTCRPSHQFMEGKQYAIGGSKIVDGKKYEDADRALEALSDYGCNHHKFGIILGVSKPAHSKQEIKERHMYNNELIEYNGKTKTRYEWQQSQRRLESGTRRERNIREMAKESGDTVLVKRCNETIARRKAAYDDLCENVRLENRWTRSAHYSSKNVDKDDISGIIKEKSKKNITVITDKAIESVPKIEISGYTEQQHTFIQQQHKELLKYARDKNDSKEVAFVFRKGLTGRTEYVGTDDSLDFGVALLGKGDNLFVMHNHPRNSGFSTTDIEFFKECNELKTITVVKNNGDVEQITKGNYYNGKIFKLEYDRLKSKIIKNGTDKECDRFVKTLLKKTKSGVEWSDFNG